MLPKLVLLLSLIQRRRRMVYNVIIVYSQKVGRRVVFAIRQFLIRPIDKEERTYFISWTWFT
jgi:hypothetical protein